MIRNDLGDRGGKLGVKAKVNFITTPLFFPFPLAKVFS
jgi:hypothetical protein